MNQFTMDPADVLDFPVDWIEPAAGRRHDYDEHVDRAGRDHGGLGHVHGHVDGGLGERGHGGAVYVLTNQIVTTGGRTKNYKIEIRVQ